MNKLKAAVCQVNPIFGKPKENMDRIEAMLQSKLAPNNNENQKNESSLQRQSRIDVILLPEMAFTGYCFSSREQILNCRRAR